MNVMIDIHGGGYALACDGCYDANHGVVEAVSALTDVLNGGAAMAGNDTSGVAWAVQYDDAAQIAVKAGCDLGTSLATLAHLLDASLANHDAADAGALLYGTAVAPPSTRTGSGRSALELTVSTPPSAAGGTGEEPTWWHWVAAHLLGLLWPDADTGRLRTVGAGWIRAADAIASYRPDVDAATARVADQTSAEIPAAVAACDEVSDQLGALSTAYAAIGQACLDYAHAVEDAHHRIEHELESFIAWTAGIEVAGALTGLLTAGAGEGVAQGVEATRIAAAAAKVRSILTALADLAATIRAAIGAACDVVTQISARLSKFLGAQVERALVRVGLREAEDNAHTLVWTSWLNYPKVTQGGREYAQIGDRLYSHHAVDRLQPSGLGAPAGAVGAGRSVSPNLVEHILSTVDGTEFTAPGGQLRRRFVSGTLTIITEGAVVVTVMSR